MQWDADLMDMSKYAGKNDGATFILLVIDVFSKYVWLQPLQNKTGAETAKAFKNILQRGRKPGRLRTDKGNILILEKFICVDKFNFISCYILFITYYYLFTGWEFLHQQTIQKFFKENSIHHFSSQNETKACIAERAIKTIKARITRYITATQNYRYIHKLQDFAKSYNETYHRSIAMTPDKVNKENETRVWWTLFWPKNKITRKSSKFALATGDLVRISNLRRTFEREYDIRWTGELFKVSKRYLRGGKTIYKIEDFHGDEIKGTFYPQELQKVTIEDDKVWKVDKILNRRTRKGKNEVLVRWLYWPKSFDSWENEESIENI